MSNIIKNIHISHIIKALSLQTIYSLFFRSILKYIFHLKYKQLNHLKVDKQFIIVANHSSHLDTVCLLAAIPRKKLITVRPIAAEDYFAKKKFYAYLSNFFVNALLISRKSGFDIKGKSIDRIIKAIDEGYSFIIYPQGTRKSSNDLDNLKEGISYVLSLRPSVYYIPAYLNNVRGLLSFKNIFSESGAFVSFGEPCLVDTKDRNKTILDIRNKIIALSEE